MPMQNLNESNAGWSFLFLAWLVAAVATVGSLFFSEVMKFTPCVLCWYQRIAMYPLVIVLLLGLFPGQGKEWDKGVFRYALPFGAIGWAIALYHNLLHYGIVPESASPCVAGVPCSTVYIRLLGFLTIPMMSLIAFTLVLAFLALFKIKTSSQIKTSPQKVSHE